MSKSSSLDISDRPNPGALGRRGRSLVGSSATFSLVGQKGMLKYRAAATQIVKSPQHSAQGNGRTTPLGGGSPHDVAVHHSCHTSWKTQSTTPLGQPQDNCFFQDVDVGFLPKSP